MSTPKSYNHAEIESKWQQKWEADGLYHSNIDPNKPKNYALAMLPYPSGGLIAKCRQWIFARTVILR